MAEIIEGQLLSYTEEGSSGGYYFLKLISEKDNVTNTELKVVYSDSHNLKDFMGIRIEVEIIENKSFNAFRIDRIKVSEKGSL